MLNGQSSPVVAEVASLKGHDEGNAEIARSDHDAVADRKLESVSCDESREGSRKDVACFLVVADDGLESEEDWEMRREKRRREGT